MQNETYSVYHLSIAPSDFDAFKQLIEPIVAATRQEPDTTIYEYVVNADHTVVHIVEARMRRSAGASSARCRARGTSSRRHRAT